MGLALWILIVSILIILYKRWVKIYDHWAERGIVHRKPWPLVGNMLLNVLRKKRLGQILNETAAEFKNSPLVGLYNFTSPVLIVNDFEYAKTVLIKEFSHFSDRNIELKHRRTVDKHLFLLTGVEWKAVRTKMTPVFTTGKLKEMVPLMEKCFHNVTEKVNSSENKIINIKDLTDLYSINVRGQCVFGLESNMDKDFVKAVGNISEFNFLKFLRLVCALFFPTLAIRLNVSFLGHDVEEYIANLLMDTIKKRAETGTYRNDFVQNLLQLKQKGSIEVTHWSSDDDYLKMDENQVSTTSVEITDDHLVAQSMIFLVAGLDVLKSSIILALMELARNKSVLDKVKQEVDSTIEKYKEFSFEAIKDMKYLEMCIKETLRLYPPAEVSLRYCVKSFVFPDGTTVERGTRVFVPINRFHWDPTYFPEPTKFDPDRFSGGSDPVGFMPFGLGPRMCIAMRFAMLELKLFLSKFIHTYDFSINAKTELPVQFDSWFFLLKTISPVYIDVSKRNHQTSEYNVVEAEI